MRFMYILKYNCQSIVYPHGSRRYSVENPVFVLNCHMNICNIDSFNSEVRGFYSKYYFSH